MLFRSGLVTVAVLARELEVYCLGRRDRPDPTVDIIEGLGATYVDSRETPVDEVAAVHEPMDLVYEATGHARHAFESVEALAPNGVAALLGVPGSWRFEIDGGRLHEEFVLNNKAMVGSVNSGPRHFRTAADTLADLPEAALTDFVTRVVDYREFGDAFEAADDIIKTAVQFSER